MHTIGNPFVLVADRLANSFYSAAGGIHPFKAADTTSNRIVSVNRMKRCGRLFVVKDAQLLG